MSMIETVEVDGTEYTLGADKDSTVAFTEAGTRANIASGESLATMFGKIKKFFTDLKTVAFTGSYDDLTDKPQVELTYAEYQALVNNDEDDPDVEYFVNDLETADTDYIETSVVTALTGATSLTISHAYITPTCRPRVFAQPASCKTAGSTQYKVKAKISSITNGSCTLSFPALAENTEFKLLINAPEVSNPSDDYSTTEVDTGKVWIDGSKVYRMVVEGTSPDATATNGTIAEIGSGKSIIRMDGFIFLSTVARIPINFYLASNTWVGTFVSSSQGGITMQVGHVNYTSKPVKVIVEYIKTTT